MASTKRWYVHTAIRRLRPRSPDYPLWRVEGPSGSGVFVFRGIPEEVIFAYVSGHNCVSAPKVFGADRALKGLTVQVLSHFRH